MSPYRYRRLPRRTRMPSAGLGERLMRAPGPRCSKYSNGTAPSCMRASCRLTRSRPARPSPRPPCWRFLSSWPLPYQVVLVMST